MQSDDLGLVERLASAGIVPAGWFLPWNEYHGYQQVAEQHNAEPDLVPLFGLDALIYLDGETQALLSGERAVLPQTKQHAEALYTVAVACLKSYGVDVEAELAAKDAAIERLVAERDESDHAASAMSSDLFRMADERDRLKEALFWIAHTFTEDSHGGTKCLPAHEYQARARAALKDAP